MEIIMNLLHGVLLVCVLSKTINSLSSDEQKRLQKIREIWTQVTSTPKAGDENIYEFINRMTHGKMFNLSVEAHAILEVSLLHHFSIGTEASFSRML